MKTRTKIKFPRIPGSAKTRTLTKRIKSKLLVDDAGPGLGLRQALVDPESSSGKHLWKLVAESSTQLFLRPDPKLGSEVSDLVFVAKDRTHATFVDCKLAEPGLSPGQGRLYVNQIGHYLKNREFPLKTVSLVFCLPEGSKLTERIVAVFDEAYQLPGLGARKTSLSDAKVSGRGTRLGWNSCKYPVTIIYKDEKFDLALTVKVLEIPVELF